jgi:hypothetical protein
MNDKKKDRFMIGLSIKLQEHMTLNTKGSFPKFISNVIITDDAIHAHKETKKRKVVAALSGSAPPRYRMVYHHGPTYLSCQQQQQWAPRPPHCQHQQAAPWALPPPPLVSCLPAPPTIGVASGHTYCNCGHSGHFARECTAPKKNVAQGHITHQPRGHQKVVVAKTIRVNYTTMEVVPEGEQVLISMFSLNRHPIIILLIPVPLITSLVRHALRTAS